MDVINETVVVVINSVPRYFPGITPQAPCEIFVRNINTRVNNCDRNIAQIQGVGLRAHRVDPCSSADSPQTDISGFCSIPRSKCFRDARCVRDKRKASDPFEKVHTVAAHHSGRIGCFPKFGNVGIDARHPGPHCKRGGAVFDLDDR